MDTGTNAIGRIKYNRYKLLTFVLAALVIANALGITGWTVNTITGLEINLPELAWAADECEGPGDCLDCQICDDSGKGPAECMDDCPPGQVCTPTGCEDCTPDPDPCGSKECGSVTDGCGRDVDCGSCPSDQTCVDGSCKDCTPDPDPCGSKECGVAPDGCGHMVGCGSCLPDQTCVDGSCEGCEPDSCEEGMCGMFPDGCGGDMKCGEWLEVCRDWGKCRDGEQTRICVSAGCICDADVCMENETRECGDGPPDDGCDPDPDPCGSMECGSAPDGCGEDVDCGSSCPSGQYCEAGKCRGCEGESPTDCHECKDGAWVEKPGNDSDCHECVDGSWVGCEDGYECEDGKCVCVPDPNPCSDVECGRVDDGCGEKIICECSEGVCDVDECVECERVPIEDLEDDIKEKIKDKFVDEIIKIEKKLMTESARATVKWADIAIKVVVKGFQAKAKADQLKSYLHRAGESRERARKGSIKHKVEELKRIRGVAEDWSDALKGITESEYVIKCPEPDYGLGPGIDGDGTEEYFK